EPFHLDLTHVNTHLQTLQAITEDVKKANLKSETKILDEARLNTALGAMDTVSKELSEAQKYHILATKFNSDQQQNVTLERRIGQFVEKFTSHNLLFQDIMRKHGISDLESSFIFNVYPQVYEAITDWNRKHQSVVDLANQKKYEEALETYTQL